MKVVKFGGTSLATAEQIKKVCNIVLADSQRRALVVSAPGKRFKEDIKVTDLLINCAEAYVNKGDYETPLNEIANRFETMANELGVKDFGGKQVREDIMSLLTADNYENDLQVIDAVKAAGEDNNAKLVAAYFNSIGVPAKYINPLEAGMYMSSDFGKATLLEESLDNLAKLKECKELIVFPGFFGYTKCGRRVTFSRGGSDISGSILAAALGAQVYENFTDVDSVYAVDPRIIENPVAIPAFTYREMRELAYAGFTVLHEDTLSYVYRAGIPVNIKNTNNPSAPGTMILNSRESYKNIVSGIAGSSDFVAINMSKYLMNKEIGFGRKLLQILEENELSFEHMPSGIDNLTVILRKKPFTPEKENIVIRRIKKELNVDHLEVDRDISLIMVVGEGMRSNVGVAAKSTKALSDARINIKVLNQGSSEVSVIFGVHSRDEQEAVRALYHTFF